MASMNTIDMTGAIALVTGAGKGLGAGCARKLAESGAEVIAVARTASDLNALAASTSGVIKTWCIDVTDDAFFDRIRGLPRLDVLVNNAGTNQPEPFDTVAPETLDRLLKLNVRTAFLAAQAAASVMKQHGSGSIIHMSSQMGHVGAKNRTVYCMTKHAIEGLTKAMAIELGPIGIRVNSVAPTFVETPMTRPYFEDPEFKQYVLDMIPMGHIAQTEDVVNAVMFLASSLSAMTTGHSLLVDGGWTAH